MKWLLILLSITLSKATLHSDLIGNNTFNVLKKEYIRYLPEWTDLDQRPLPRWYDVAKVGIFLHWGVYSVPGFGSEWFWMNWKDSKSSFVEYMKEHYRPGFTYQEFAPMFTAEFYDPQQWASLFVKAGAKYVVLTSKHHDGYTLFPSKRSFGWNSVEVGPKQDLVGTLAMAVRAKGLKFGVYHSLYEWFNPIYLEDKNNNFDTRNFAATKVWPDIKQLVHDYKPSVIWSDGDWDNLDTYWNSTDLLAWLYNDSPVKDEIVVNDRWGKGIPCHHGDFYNCEDRYNPGKLQNHKWENAFTIDSKSWGHRRNIHINDILTIERILEQLVSTVSCGGNVLINIGPTKEGTIPVIFQERLLQLGDWLKVNGEAIYGSSPWQYQNDSLNSDVWYTCTKQRYNGLHPTSKPLKTDNINAIYAIVLKWPTKNVLKIRDIVKYVDRETVKVQMLGEAQKNIYWNISDGEMNVVFPDLSNVTSEHAWTLKFT